VKSPTKKDVSEYFGLILKVAPVLTFVWIAAVYYYHHAFLFPMLEREYEPVIEKMIDEKIKEAETRTIGMDAIELSIKDWVKASLHTALLADANHLYRSYEAIPEADKKPHHIERMRDIKHDQEFHAKHFDKAEEKGLILPVFPPPR